MCFLRILRKKQWKYKHNSPITEYTDYIYYPPSYWLNEHKSIGERGWFIDEATTVIRDENTRGFGCDGKGLLDIPTEDGTQQPLNET